MASNIRLKNSRIFLPLLVVVFLLSAVSLIPLANTVGTTFGSEVNLSNSNEDSTVPQIAVNGSNIYVVWRDIDDTNSDTDILISNSTDGGTTFSTPINVTSTSTDNDAVPQLAVSDTHVYVIWQNGTSGNTDIFFSAADVSEDESFTTPVNLSEGSSFTGASQEAQIAVNGSNVYVVWTDFSEDGSDGEIYIRSSTDNGTTFSPSLSSNPTNLSSTTGEPSLLPQIVAAGHSAYIIWQDKLGSTDIISFRGSINSGASFSSTSNLNKTSTSSIQPDLAVTGNTIHTAWESGTGLNNIAYRTITNGTSFTFSPSLGSDPTTISTATNAIVDDVHIAANGNKVYVAWQDIRLDDLDKDIIFSNSTDGGSSFSEPQDLSSNDGDSFDHQLSLSGDNVYVVWRDDTKGSSTDRDLLIRSSFSTNFASFGGTVEVTDDGTDATSVQLFANGTKVYVVWDDNGNDPNGGSDSEILFIVGTTASADVGFTDTSDVSATQFKLTDTARIKVTAPNSNTNSGTAQEITVTVTTSVSDTLGISVKLNETGANTGVFTGDITFSTLASDDDSDVLKASPGETITATFDSQSGTASIFSRTVSLSSPTFTLGSIPFVTVDDNNSNTNTSDFDTIDVTISSVNGTLGDNNPIIITLNETGTNTGVFGVSSGIVFVFMNEHGEFPQDRNITVTQEDLSENKTSTIIDTTTISVASDTFTAGSTITLFETNVNTGVFTGKIKFITGTSSGNSIQALPGDFVSITHGDLTERGLISPNTNSSRGALQVKVSEDTGIDSITASFGGATDTASLSFSLGESGGGGGGLVRPSLVLDIIASLAAGGGGRGAAPVVTLNDLRQSSFVDIPDEIEKVVINFDPFTPLEPYDVTAEQFETFDFPLSIDNDGYALSGYSNTIDTKTLHTGEATKIKTVFYMTLKLEHVALYINIKEGDTLDDSDTFLRFWKSKPDQFQIKDENGFLEYINLTIEEDGIKKTATFDLKFVKPMAKSDIVLRMWDEKLHSTTVLIFDAIEVVGPSIIQLEETSTEGLEISETAEEPQISQLTEAPIVVPDWIKSNARWWNEGQITDMDFAKGIEYLIKNEIIEVPPAVFEEQEQTVETIPDWVKSNAGWWGNGLLTDQDFVNGIEWLINNGIIRI